MKKIIFIVLVLGFGSCAISQPTINQMGKDICQTLVQKSALQLVHEYLLIEAKKYLLGTSNSIAEISYFLDFKDPSHFSKFFRKMSGASPREFRRQSST